MIDRENLLSKYPRALLPHIKMDKPDAPIILYSGKYSLQNDTKKINIEGTIQYKWPQQGRIMFEGRHTCFLELENNFVLCIHDRPCAVALITRQSSNFNTPAYIQGIISDLTLGNKTEKCDKVCFSLINLPKLFGENIRRDKMGIARDRLTFQRGEYTVIIENHQDLKNKASTIDKIQEGYSISHYGQITKAANQISVKEADEILTAFSMYISFVFGKRHMPFFLHGYKENKKVCEYYCAANLPILTGTFSWAPPFKYTEIKSLWNNFFDMWQLGEDKRDILITAIHWYLEANMNSGALEGAYIMAFAGIELMYNVLIGVKGKDSTIKIKALTDLLNISSIVKPKELSDMRNVLVHYGQENRMIYAKIEQHEKLHRLHRVIYILELSILKYLDYQGIYRNRLHAGKWKGEGIELVPYALKM